MQANQVAHQSVWSEYISARNARNVARALRNAGYGSATIEKCRGYVINIAQYFEPGDQVAQREVIAIATSAAGIAPRR